MWRNDRGATHALVLACLCGLSLAASSADLDRVKARGTLEVAVYDNFPPYSFKDKGRTVGIDADIGRALAAKLGVSASIRAVGADENMEDDLRNNVWKGHYLGGGTADLMLHVPADREFAEDNDRVWILGAYHREEIVLARDADRAGDLGMLELLSRHKVGVELDTLSDFYLLGAMGGRLRESVVHFRSVAEATAALRAGELMSVMGPRTEVEGTLGPDAGRMVITRMDLPGMRASGWDLGFAVKEGNTDLAQALEQAMAELRAEGAIEAIFARYGLRHVAPSPEALAMRPAHRAAGSPPAVTAAPGDPMR